MSKRSHRSRWEALPTLDPFFGAFAAYLVACLVLGGGTREGYLGDVVLQASAVPLLLWSGWRLWDVPTTAGGRRGRLALLGCLLAVALPAAHLMPLPPSVWTGLPGRSDFESNLLAAGLEVGWLPLSLVPRATWLSALALLPPMAVFLGTLQLSYADRRRFSLVLLTTGLVSVGIGLLQVAQGPSSPLRFYAFTNASEAVGFFANRNHYAALLYCLVLIAAVWTVSTIADFTRSGATLRSRRSTPKLIAMVASFTIVVVLIAAQAMARSRAGLGLTTVALLGAFALAFVSPRGAATAAPLTGATWRLTTRLLLAAIAVALLFAAQFALYRVQERFELDPLTDARLPFARNTIEAAIAFMPFGSGMGTFVSVYQTFEKASDNVASVYANRAHNDFLELWLEAGVVGLVIMGLFMAWTIVALWRVWRRGSVGAGYTDRLLARAAVVMILLLLAHSSVDYPLRTAALMAVLVWSAAMAIVPVGIFANDDLAATGRRPRSARSGAQVPAGSPQSDAEAGPKEGAERHRQFVPAPPRNDWPAAWRQPPSRPSDDD